jgi:hypothetical protein
MLLKAIPRYLARGAYGYTEVYKFDDAVSTLRSAYTNEPVTKLLVKHIPVYKEPIIDGLLPRVYYPVDYEYPGRSIPIDLVAERESAVLREFQIQYDSFWNIARSERPQSKSSKSDNGREGVRPQNS